MSRKLVGVEIGGERLGAYNDGSMIDFFVVEILTQDEVGARSILAMDVRG